MTVLFNDLHEFCDELRQDATQGVIERNIVRAANVFRSGQRLPSIRTVHFVATYAIKDRLQLVQLDLFCGEYWQNGSDSDQKTQERVVNSQAELERAVDRLKDEGLRLELRSGVLMEVMPNARCACSR